MQAQIAQIAYLSREINLISEDLRVATVTSTGSTQLLLLPLLLRESLANQPMIGSNLGDDDCRKNASSTSPKWTRKLAGRLENVYTGGVA